jgi:hypothetical protein
MAKRQGFFRIAACVFAMFCAAGLSPVKADMDWTWSYVNAESGVDASGTLTTKDQAAGAARIISVAGVWNGAAITGLEPVKSCCSPPGWNSNMLIEGETKLDKAGFAFGVSGGARINLFYKDGRYAYEIENGPEVFGGVFAAAPGGKR